MAQDREYKLSAQLAGHTDDVRGLCICGESTIATASRDTTVRVWNREDGAREFKLGSTLTGHKSFVSAVAWIPPSEALPQGGLVSGGMDTLVIIWDLESSKHRDILSGHELQVTSVVFGKENEIYSTSIDSTIRRWTKGGSEVLNGHKVPVQAAIILPDGILVTGSSDTKIKFWRGSSCTKTINAHSDTVRGLALMPNVGFLSASHDCSVKLWSASGDLLLEMVGHTSIVYSVAGHSSGDVASGSEDCHAKIWRGGSCVQSLEHPGCVWDVKFLPNGDLVTACSDGVARVWTLDPSRYASAEEIAVFEASVSARKTQKKSIGGVKVSELPGIESLQQPGQSNGQNKVVREGDTAVAYCWNMKEYKWEKIGEVVDGPEDVSSAQTINGVKYDYVFDVDIGDGQPTRKLPYNKGENPYDAADKWLASENLSMAYRQQVVDFILQHTGQQQNYMQLDDCFYDPYTGGSAYVPRQPQNFVSGIAAPKPQSYKFKHVPRTGILLFDGAQYDGILKKMLEFNNSLAIDVQLTPEEVQKVQAMVAVLKDTKQYQVGQFAESDFDTLVGKLSKWPAANIFPVLDLLKVLVLHPQAANYFSQHHDMVENMVKAALSSGPVVNGTISARILVNCFRHECFRDWLLRHRSEILDLFAQFRCSPNKNMRSAYAHLLLNYAVRLTTAKDEDGQIQVLSAALEMAGPQEEDAEIKFLALQAIGTLIHSGLVKSVAADLDLQSIAQDLKKSSVSKLAEIGADLEYLLK